MESEARASEETTAAALRAGGALALAYWLAAVAGLQWAAIGGAGSPVWPAAGVALAGLLLGGVRLWPAIVVGRLAAGAAVGSEHHLGTELAIALGNALGAALPALFLTRLRIDARLVALRDVLWLALGCVASAAISATVGTSALALSVGFGLERALDVAWSWHFGALVGGLCVAPAILAWSGRRSPLRSALDVAHFGAVVAATALVSGLVFLGLAAPSFRTWYVFPVLIWAALAFDVRGASVAIAIATASATWGATIGVGPFVGIDPAAGSAVALAQQFASIAAATTLVLAAVADERRGAEALRRSEERLLDVLESTTDSVLVVDRDWRVGYANARARARLAEGRDIVGDRLWDVFPDREDGPFRRAFASAAAAGRATSAEAPLAALEGRFRAEAHPSRTGLTVFFRDVTEERRAAARLSESQARLRAVLAQMPVGVAIAAVPTGELLFSNGKADELIGRQAGSKSGIAGEATYGAVHADGSPYRQEEHPIARAVRTGETIDRELTAFRREDGRVVQLEVSASRVYDTAGRPVLAVCTFDDVTARTRAEEALAALAADLERRVEEGAARLTQMQKMEGLGRLTGGVAHDFNNLLMAVMSALELLAKRLPEGDARARRLLDNAMEGARRGASLTRRMLAFARRQDLKPEPVDVARLIEGMRELLRRSLGPQIRIEARLERDLPAALVDANQLELALLNLAVNARDAMPDGGLLRLSLDAVTIGVGAEIAPGRYLRLVVADEGSGMDEATLARAVEPFFTTKSVGRGTGMGLSMAHGLAAQSGGRLALRSAPGAGTTVELLLPASREAPASASDEAPAAASPPERALHVLAVDDDPLVLAGAAGIVEDLGHRVTGVPSAADALAAIRAGAAVDVVVTDQMMPGMTGLELARALAAERPGLPVVLATGYADLPESALEPLAAVIGKPFGRDALADALARATARADGPPPLTSPPAPAPAPPPPPRSA